ncbi:hypothetical protein ERO13_D04G164040v2 [Gossypium hirsutum]|nr:hypothetical protein ERO13_D04G164040v2 [Gossypium hirsutum]
MSMKSVSFSFHLLLLLLLVMHGDGSGTEEMADDLISKGNSVLRLHSMDHDRQTEDDGTTVQSRVDPLSHMDHMDLSVMVFFTLKDLKVGNSLPIYFRKKDSSKSPRFLPRQEADSIAFSLKELPNLLRLFSFSRDSPRAKAMKLHLENAKVKQSKGRPNSALLL